MEVSSWIGRYGWAVAISGIGMTLAWLSREPSPLLAVVTAICVYGRKWPALLSIGCLALAFVVVHLAQGSLTSIEPLQVVSFFAVALAISVLLHDYQHRVSSDRADSDAHLIVESMPGLGWSTDPIGNFKYVNQSVLDYVGVPPRDLSRIEGTDDFGWRLVVHPDDVERATKLWLRSLDTGQPYESTHRVQRFDGSYRWFRAVGRSSRGVDGRITGWYGTTIDIDDQAKAEEALRRTEQQLRLLIDTIPALVWSATPDGEPSYLNKRLMDYLGLSLEDFDDPEGNSRQSTAIQAVVHPDDISNMRSVWSRSVATGRPFTSRYRLRRADGVFRWVDGRGEALHDCNGRVLQWYCVNVDIDDETRMQDALRSTLDKLARASRAASLAEMSASIAHEVNQPLAAVVANGHACQQWLSADPPNLQRARIVMERVIRDANSAAQVVSRTRALFQRTAPVKVQLNLTEVIVEVLHLMADESIAKGVSFETDLESNLSLIAADRTQIQQVLVNLLRNALDAMELECRQPKSILIRSRADGALGVLVDVRDHGKGIDDLERVFEPFFTTKEKGLGMGLAICRSIVEAHGGRLWALRNDDGGTTFSFTIPTLDNDFE